MNLKTYDRQYFSERIFKEPDLALQHVLLEHVIQTPAQGKRVLDVGCGLGIYISFLKKHGIEAYGVDTSHYAARISRQSIASATHLPFRSEVFDAIISAHLMEHLKESDEVTFLREARRILKPGGRLFLLTPNSWCPIKVLYGKKWFYDPLHINLQSPSKSKKTLQKCGFLNITFIFKIPPNPENTRGIKERLKYLPYFLASSTPLAYFRPVIYILANKLVL